ncbi:MAG: SDR family oxidoreductase [Pseudomonadota bacterium]
MATFLVTGGAGFIGSNITRALLSRGDTVRVIDNFSTGKEENLAELTGLLRIFRGDVIDSVLVKEAMSGCDYVLHQAALPSVPRSIAAPLHCDRVNVLGTLTVLEAARELAIKRVVYASSSSVYGESLELPKAEGMRPAPLSPYAVSKLAGEHYMAVYAHCYGLETVSLRYFNVFGPRQDPASEYAAVIPRFVNAVLEERSPTIFGDGTQSRDFCFVDNVVEANLLACTAPGVAGKCFNIACGAQTTLLEVLQDLAAILGRRAVAFRQEPPRAGDIMHSLADISMARQALGYSARVDFRGGLARTVEWYRASSQIQGAIVEQHA